MPDLEALLYTDTATWEDVVAYFRGECENDEHRDVTIIRRHLLTLDQAAWLASHNLDLYDLLNGRWPSTWAAEIDSRFHQPWNQRLGFTAFRIL